MTQDITKEEAERRLREAGIVADRIIVLPSGTGLMASISIGGRVTSGITLEAAVSHAIFTRGTSPARWTEAEVRREFERDVKRCKAALTSDDAREYFDNHYDTDFAGLRAWYGISALPPGTDASFMHEFLRRPETRNCALGVVGYSVEKPAPFTMEVVTPTHDDGTVTDKQYLDGSIVEYRGRAPTAEEAERSLKTLAGYVPRPSLTTAQRDCIYVPRAYQVLKELYDYQMWPAMEPDEARGAATIIARHLGEPVPEQRQKVFTLHTKQLESGEWECRVQTIEKLCHAVVTGRTRAEAEVAGERCGRVL